MKSREVDLGDLDPGRFLMNGKALCLMTPAMFVYRVPRGGVILYRDFQTRLCRAVAIVHHNNLIWRNLGPRDPSVSNSAVAIEDSDLVWVLLTTGGWIRSMHLTTCVIEEQESLSLSLSLFWLTSIAKNGNIIPFSEKSLRESRSNWSVSSDVIRSNCRSSFQ